MIIFVWRACPVTTNGNEQAHRNVNCDGVNLTLLGGITRGRAFDDRAAQSIDVHVSLDIGVRDRDSTRVYRASRSITRQGMHASLIAAFFTWTVPLLLLFHLLLVYLLLNEKVKQVK
ncbi:hypothetical protein DFJ58DRAFT_655192 [Suillus subalutaceus]|uniref:uncharacterized protein n=1 Tax=Suillus subalutaceus TaxID=48586 RepID=UPI001B870883|nr:uncharacterized protein DFJ58DRAFT_655192 [Suillus subalutaceus]KAG1865876.1 hypothetical protein DFJ58DRAFT_655192 [Suillus subalutaceus]